GMRKASSPWWSDAASHRNFFSSERRTRARAPGRAKPRSLNTVAKMRKTCACEPLDLWAAPAGAKIDVALASQTKPTRAIVKRTKVRWPKGERGTPEEIEERVKPLLLRLLLRHRPLHRPHSRTLPFPRL